MTPKQATNAYQRGELREGADAHQPYGFLRGERNNGRVLSVDCKSGGDVRGATVLWPDESTPVYVDIEDLDLAATPCKPTLRDRVKALFSHAHFRPQ
jgi:hypothetical protein